MFAILLQIQHENNFLPTSKHWQAKVCHILGICLYFFIYRLNFVNQKINVSKRGAILARVAKQWMAKAILSYESQSKCAKIAIHWFGKY